MQLVMVECTTRLELRFKFLLVCPIYDLAYVNVHGLVVECTTRRILHDGANYYVVSN